VRIDIGGGNRQPGSRKDIKLNRLGRHLESAPGRQPGSLLLSQLREQMPAILADEPVQLAYLYGSSVSERTTPFSDVDVALVVGTMLQPLVRLELILRVRLALADCCGIDADVRVIDDAPLVFRGRVVTDGVPIFARSEDLRVAFETQTRMRYFDYLPIHRQLQESFFQNVRERGLHGRS
jgi:predicted nucleotidyltransferase